MLPTVDPRTGKIEDYAANSIHFRIPSVSSLCNTYVMLSNLTEALQLKISVVHFDEKQEEQVTKPQCYDLNVCVPPNLYVEILIAKNDSIRRRALLMNFFLKGATVVPCPSIT